MAHAVFTNNARTTLSGSLTNVATSAAVVDGSVFPAPTGGDYAYLTIEEGALVEIVKLTARSTNTLTITRAQDGTTAQAFTTAATVSLRLPRVVLDEFQAAIDGKQTQDAELSAIAGLTSAADRLPYFTGSGTAALATFTSAGRALVDDADAAAQRTTLGVAIGTNVQAYDAGLQSIAGLTTLADRSIYTTASDTYAVYTLTAAGRAILDDADASAQRTTLGLGTAALKNTGTSGDAVPLLNAANTWSAQQTFSPGDTETIFNRSTDTPFTIQLKSAGTTRGYIGMDSTNFQVWDASLSRNLTFNLSTGVLSVTSNTVWHAGNDGAGSGLDADTLDGVQGSAFALLATDNTFDRNLTFSGYRNITLPTGNAFGRIQARYNTTGGFHDHFIMGVNWLRDASGASGTVNNASLGTSEIELIATNGSNGTINLRAGAANTAPTTRVRINGSTGQTVEIDGRLNITSALGTLRSTIDWGYTQTGLTIYNNDSTPITFGTAGVARMNISGTGAITLGTQAPQSTALAGMRANGNNFEWGHTNTAGYQAALGAEVNSGAIFITFNAEAGTNNNTYRTRGLLGSGIRSNNAGGMTFFTLTNSNADNQSPTDRMAVLAGTNPGVEINAKLNLTTSIGTTRSTFDWGHTQSGLTIWNNDNTPLYLGTTATNRVAISATGDMYYTATPPGPSSTVSIGFRGAPRNRQDSSYTLVLADAGFSIVGYGSTASQTWTIPANSSVAYPIGTTITFVNMRSVACSIACTTDTMYLAGVGTTGTRTLASYGWATAVKVDTTNWLIGGTGLT